MKKLINATSFVILLCILTIMAFGCSMQGREEEIPEESIVTEDATAEATTEAITTTVSETVIDSSISDEEALRAITNLCCIDNPDLASLSSEERLFYWEIVSSDADQIVVLFRSYTGAQIRYYINRSTGDTYVTELVPGIIDEEQTTDQSFNVRDYIPEEITY